MCLQAVYIHWLIRQGQPSLTGMLTAGLVYLMFAPGLYVALGIGLLLVGERR
jgi:hypothetical protein